MNQTALHDTFIIASAIAVLLAVRYAERFKEKYPGYGTSPLVLIYGRGGISRTNTAQWYTLPSNQTSGQYYVALSTTDTSGYAIQLPAVAETPRCADRQIKRDPEGRLKQKEDNHGRPPQ
ncbi:hypothetical protein ACLBOM_33150 [Escherichia coli]